LRAHGEQRAVVLLIADPSRRHACQARITAEHFLLLLTRMAAVILLFNATRDRGSEDCILVGGGQMPGLLKTCIQ